MALWVALYIWRGFAGLDSCWFRPTRQSCVSTTPVHYIRQEICRGLVHWSMYGLLTCAGALVEFGNLSNYGTLSVLGIMLDNDQLVAWGDSGSSVPFVPVGFLFFDGALDGAWVTFPRWPDLKQGGPKAPTTGYQVARSSPYLRRNWSTSA